MALMTGGDVCGECGHFEHVHRKLIVSGGLSRLGDLGPCRYPIMAAGLPHYCTCKTFVPLEVRVG